MTFTPLEFFAAAARCSHLHVINPRVVTPESLIISSLVEQHVDDSNTDFAILSTADNFKDYIKSYFAGTVAAGLAYLQMIKDGYVWSDHFETLGGGAPGVARTPDFVFARPGEVAVALVESKGTRSANHSAFDSTVDDGYTGQVEPHLGHFVGGALANHGFCIGGWLTSATKAELNIHHTAVARGAGSTPPANTGNPSATVQRHNYATAFRLAHSDTLAGQVRRGVLDIQPIPFVEFSWLNLRFLTSASVGRLRLKGSYWFGDSNRPSSQVYPPQVIGPACGLPQPFNILAFAVERERADTVLRRISATNEAEHYDVTPIAEEVSASARREGGALLPDGLAVIGAQTPIREPRLVVWRDGGVYEA